MYPQTNTFKKNFYLYLYFLIVFISFLLGFFFNEDSSGGGLVDFKHEWTSIQEFKLGINSALTSMKYESSRTPLFLILNYFNPFNDAEYSFRFSNFIFNLFIPISFFYLLRKKYYDLSFNLIVAISILLYLSPYFRTSSYWAHQENLPVFFTICSLLYLQLYESNRINRNIIHIFGIAIVSSLAFYSDQKYIFISLYCFIKLIVLYRNNYKNIFFLCFFFFISSLPTFYLFYLWKGILPIQSQFRIGFYPKNISLGLSIISFYFLPLFLILKNKFSEILKSIEKADIIFLIFLTFIIIFSIPDFQNPWGGGAIYKIFYVLNLFINNEIITKIIFLIFVIISTFLIYILLKQNILNFFPLLIIIILSTFVEMTYQEYFDPIIIVLLFSYFKFHNKYVNIVSKKIVFYYSLFFIFFLIFANIYYNQFNLVN